jgi:hypothetical protein
MCAVKLEGGGEVVAYSQFSDNHSGKLENQLSKEVLYSIQNQSGKTAVYKIKIATKEDSPLDPDNTPEKVNELIEAYIKTCIENSDNATNSAAWGPISLEKGKDGNLHMRTETGSQNSKEIQTAASNTNKLFLGLLKTISIIGILTELKDFSTSSINIQLLAANLTTKAQEDPIGYILGLERVSPEQKKELKEKLISFLPKVSLETHEDKEKLMNEFNIDNFKDLKNLLSHLEGEELAKHTDLLVNLSSILSLKKEEPGSSELLSVLFSGFKGLLEKSISNNNEYEGSDSSTLANSFIESKIEDLNPKEKDETLLFNAEEAIGFLIGPNLPKEIIAETLKQRPVEDCLSIIFTLADKLSSIEDSLPEEDAKRYLDVLETIKTSTELDQLTTDAAEDAHKIFLSKKTSKRDLSSRLSTGKKREKPVNFPIDILEKAKAGFDPKETIVLLKALDAEGIEVVLREVPRENHLIIIFALAEELTSTDGDPDETIKLILETISNREEKGSYPDIQSIKDATSEVLNTFFTKGDISKDTSIKKNPKQKSVREEQLKILNNVHPELVPLVNKIETLEDEKTLFVFTTRGDGSCGFYSLLGEPNLTIGSYRLDDADIQEKRAEFVDWLEKNNSSEATEILTRILEDYFTNFDDASTGFKNTPQVKALRNGLFAKYKALPKSKQDEAKANFINNRIIRRAYFDNLKKQGTYLLQDELACLAIHLEKQVTLCQPGWGKGKKIAVPEKENSLNPNGGENLVVYYNGYNHYEKALILP